MSRFTAQHDPNSRTWSEDKYNGGTSRWSARPAALPKHRYQRRLNQQVVDMLVGHGHASGQAVIAVVAIMTSLACVFVSLRLYARFWISKNAGWDDAFIALSALFSIANMITVIAQVNTGLGRHVWTISKYEAMLNLRALWASIIVYNVALNCTKLAILLQYLRIFPHRAFRIATWVMIGIVVAHFIWRFFAQVFACIPVPAYWDHSIKTKHCIDRTAASLASTSINMVTDIMIAALPLPILRNLELPTRQRRALMAVFALGGFVCIVSILRVPFLYAAIHTEDVSYHNPMAAILSNVECDVGIICSCIPTLRCLFPRIFHASSYMFSSSGASSDYQAKKAAYALGMEDSFGSRKGPISSHATGPATPEFGSSGITQLPRKVHGHRYFRSVSRRDTSLLGDADSIDQIEMDSRGDVGREAILVKTEIDQISMGRELKSDAASTRGLVRSEPYLHDV